ncbi:MAG: tRNA (adenosine(37)-N6)-dimethylallyltransferase MiaA [Spirochaetaceae bacterium]|jgi:tRNA dimethylallyltransferase|nr:tRNA (adenosine(37)-N6)-dimethylallyltransferase MiaA [Spirochaetaceae bacterium]
MPEIPVIVLFGPTASGKTALLEELFSGGKKTAAETISAEIVSADSMQVYRGMDIGTAKPPPDFCAALPHHLIDILDPDEQFNAGEFARRADQTCEDIHKRGMLPVISGGAGFYLKNFIQGLPEAPPADAAVREKLSAELLSAGAAALRSELQTADPESAARIHPNDEYRLLRALEVIRISGHPLSSFAVNAENHNPKYKFLLIGLERERETLYRRINERCAEMFKAGLAQEVRALFEKHYTPRDPGLKAIGYKEFFIDNYDGTYRFSDDTAGVEALTAQHSRQYAKRQITWFKKIQDVTWIRLDEKESIRKTAALIQEKIAVFLENSGNLRRKNAV